MNTIKLRTFLAMASFALILAGDTNVRATTLEGIVQGYGCVVIQKLCATDQNDPRAAMEKNFVIVDKNGTYYFITNIDSSVFSGNILRNARVTGVVDSKYNSVTAEKLEFFSKGSWREVWSQKMERERMETFSSTAG